VSMGHGQWIIENMLLLTVGGADPGPPPPEGTVDGRAIIVSPSGHRCVRFEAARVAGAMAIGSAHVLKTNSRGKLAARCWEVAPKPGDIRAMRFRLSFGKCWFEITLGYGSQ
jgi:hypothetical protein